MKKEGRKDRQKEFNKYLFNVYGLSRASQVIQWERIHLGVQEMQKSWVWFLGQEDPPE